MDNPNVVIYFRPRDKSPLADNFYYYLRDNSDKINYHPVIDTSFGVPLQYVMKSRLNNKKPDMVIGGFGCRGGLTASVGTLEGIKVMLTVADIANHTGPQNDARNQSVYIDYLLHNFQIPGYDTDILLNFVESCETQRNSTYKYVPWCIDSNRYKQNDVRDIDVNYLCTISANWYHYYRHGIANKLMQLKGYNIYPDFRLPGGKEVFGHAYRDLLSRSKIMVVDSCGTGMLTQKYLEGAVSGCLLIGEKPVGYDDLFDDCFVEAGPENLINNIEVYLSDDKARERKAGILRQRIYDNFAVEKIASEFDDMILRCIND